LDDLTIALGSCDAQETSSRDISLHAYVMLKSLLTYDGSRSLSAGNSFLPVAPDTKIDMEVTNYIVILLPKLVKFR